MFEQLFSATAIPHGYCLSWQTGVVLLHVISNALIFIAYITIPIIIYVFIHHKHKNLLNKHLFWLFAFFIVACALTHLMEIVVIWKPYYLLQGLFTAISATVSTLTAIELIRQMPNLLQQPTVTELQSVNQALAEQIAHNQALEKKLRLTQFAIDNATEGVLLVKQDSTILYANNAIMNYLGYSEAEILALTVPEIDPRLNPELWQNLWQQLKLKKSCVFETSLVKKDRTPLLVEVNVCFLEYENQEYHCSFIHDISQQKKIEQALKNNETMLKQAQEIAHVGHWQRDLTQDTLFWSDEVYRIFDLQPQEFNPCFESFLSYVHPEDQELLKQTYRYHLKQQTPDYEIEHRLLLKNGVLKYVQEKCKTEFDPQGQPLQSLGIVFDITEQKQAQQRITDLLDLNLQIISQSSAGVKVFNALGHCISCNDAAAKTLNKTVDQVLQESFYTLPLWQTTGLLDTALKCLRQKQPQRQEVHTTLASGKEIWLDYNFATIRKNNELNLLVIIHDVTEYRLAEIAMQQAKLAAIAASQAKSDFLANMSHEIRTPMNAVIGMSHLMLKTELDARQQDFMKKIQLSSRHLLGILNDILDFSKIEAGKLSVEQTEFDIDEVLDNVTTQMQEKTSAKSLELLIKVDPAIPDYLIGDPMRVGQILINYANNAVKFTERGHILIELRQQQETESQVQLYFSVTDTGIGLSEEQRQSLFQSFQQGDSSTTRKYGGTGLGLAISKKLAQLMSGEVGVISELDKGSTFWFTAWLGKSKKQKRKLLMEAGLQGRKILIADDKEYSREIFRRQLEKMSFKTQAITLGEETTVEIKAAATQNQPYEIVFLDGAKAIETAQQIQSLALQPAPHLVLLNNFGHDDLIAKAESIGIDKILIKPVSVSVLFDSAINLLHKNGKPENNAEKVAPKLVFGQLQAIQGAQVLLVEDNDLNQEVAVELLKEIGIIVDVAENGDVALHKLQENHYDLILMDMQMPIMDGITATQIIRTLPEFADLPIVAMTANAMQQDRERCLAAGMNDHLPKPIEPDDLWTVLRKWLKPRPFNPYSSPEPDIKTTNNSVAIPDNIPTLDADVGLRRMAGKRELYVSMLKKFVSHQESAISQLQAALEINDSKTAERLAHTLKGLAGNIGAVRLQEQAAQLETALHNHENAQTLNAILPCVAQLLSELIAGLKSWLMNHETQQLTAPVIDTKNLQTIVAELMQLLADDDAESADYLAQHHDLLRAAFPENFETLEKMVSNYDFSDAIKILKQEIN